MFSCRDVTEHASDHIDGKLARMTGLRFRMHVFICRNCRNYLAQLRQTVSLLRAMPPDDLPEAAAQPLLDAFRETRARKRPGADLGAGHA